ncbi:hypothetical protein WISP_26083 [Willisornis vidua]|uniref:Uncharacterized protein n=1 Tax=Willisornis vidua TaxID=1566151 RepID=A0ABQ9DLQ1_9PASS|nr:hypothetical protein WISP_26083 [Willisornis vidua]
MMVMKIDKEIDNRLAKAYRAFRKLHKRVWLNKHLKKNTKICVYRAIVLSPLLYGSESWVIYHHHLQLLKRCHQHCLPSILNIHWSDYVTNVSILEQARVTSIEAMLMRMLGRAHLQDGGSSPSEDCALWQIRHRLPQERSPEEVIQGLPETTPQPWLY